MNIPVDSTQRPDGHTDDAAYVRGRHDHRLLVLGHEPPAQQSRRSLRLTRSP